MHELARAPGLRDQARELEARAARVLLDQLGKTAAQLDDRALARGPHPDSDAAKREIGEIRGGRTLKPELLHLGLHVLGNLSRELRAMLVEPGENVFLGLVELGHDLAPLLGRDPPPLPSGSALRAGAAI